MGNDNRARPVMTGRSEVGPGPVRAVQAAPQTMRRSDRQLP